MKRSLPKASWLVAAVVVLSITWLVPADPILPDRDMQPDKVLTLAHIEKVRLEILPMTEAVRDLGLSKKRLRLEWKTQLETAGVKVVDDEAAPGLRCI
jgi:hypothetical protein